MCARRCCKSGEKPIVGKCYRLKAEGSNRWQAVLNPKVADLKTKVADLKTRLKMPRWKELCEAAYQTLSKDEQEFYDDGVEATHRRTPPEKHPNQRLLLCTATYREPSAEMKLASGGKMCESIVNLRYGLRDAYIKGLDDLIASPVLTIEMEFSRNSEWTDWRGEKFRLRDTWAYVTGPAKELNTGHGIRDRDNDGKTPDDFLASANGFISSRRRELLKLDPKLSLLPEAAAYLTLEEVLAVRLYSGPAYQPINVFLRQIANLTGEHRVSMARHAGLTFAATIGHICSAIRKLAAVATPDEAKAPLWRGVRGVLPKTFWVADEKNMVCAVDQAFMSTSTNKETPIDYMAGDGKPNVLWCLQPQTETDIGYHRGADISRLSQYAWEGEGAQF